MRSINFSIKALSLEEFILLKKMNHFLNTKRILVVLFCFLTLSVNAQNPIKKTIDRIRQFTEEITDKVSDKVREFTSPEDAEKQSSSDQKIEALEIPMSPASLSEELIPHLGYTLSYNYRHRIPNWVAWELTRHEVGGTVPRASGFKPDPLVKGTQADDADYRNSGWDRGHMAPAADMKWSSQAMRESFYLSNVCPQNQNLNRGDWKDLEELEREVAQRYGNVWIVCGPIIGEARNGRIGSSRATVPDAFYKVMPICHNGRYESIGFIFKNEAGSHKLSYYTRTVDQIEEITGLDFFPQLPDSIEAEVESRKDHRPWRIQ